MPEHYEITATSNGFFVKQPMPYGTYRYLEGLDAMRVVLRLIKPSPDTYTLKLRQVGTQTVQDTVEVHNGAQLERHLHWLRKPVA